MPSVGPGVREIRIHTDGEHRVIYVAMFEEAIYVLHAFEKKTRKTRRADMDVGRKRLRDVLRDRERKKAGPAKGVDVMARTRVQRSTGSVFRDLGFGPEEAASLKIRADLMIE